MPSAARLQRLQDHVARLDFGSGRVVRPQILSNYDEDAYRGVSSLTVGAVTFEKEG